MGKNHIIPLISVVLLTFLGHPAHARPPDTRAQTLAQINTKADHAIQAGDLSSAAVLIKQGLKIDPDWKDGLWKAGLVLYQENQFESARGYLYHLTQLDAKRGLAWALLGMCQVQLGEYQAAIENITRADRLGIPNQSGLRFEALLDRAIAQNNLRNFGKTVTLLNKIVTRIPDISLAERERIIAIYGYASLEESTNSSLSPRQAAVLHTLGVVRYTDASGDRALAKSLIENLLQKHPKQTMLHFTYGDLLASWQDYDAAKKEFQAELAVNPSSIPTRLALAFLGLNTGKISEALPYAIAASKMSPDFYLPHFYLGRLLIRAGHLREGCEQLEIASRLSPSNSEVRYNLATAYRRLGRIKDAEREYKEFQHLKALASGGQASESTQN